MIGECIYSQRYFVDPLNLEMKKPALMMYRNRDVTLTDEDFIQFAIEFSQKNSIGLDLYEREDRLQANFFLYAEELDEENAIRWDGLMSASHYFSLIVRNMNPQTVRACFMRIKSKYLKQ